MVLAAGIEVQTSSVGGGKRLVATLPIKKGEMVWREDLDGERQYTSIPRTWAWIQALPEKQREIYCHFMYKTGTSFGLARPQRRVFFSIFKDSHGFFNAFLFLFFHGLMDDWRFHGVTQITWPSRRVLTLVRRARCARIAR
jgi:hypothetical protein